MRTVLLLMLLFHTLLSYEYKTDISLNYINYANFKNETILKGNSKIKFENDYFSTNISFDYLYSSEYKKRRYLLLNELYFTNESDNYTINIGKSIKFWGELEGYNIGDIYNQKNYLLDPFDKDKKLGSIGGDFRYYFDDDYVDVGIKVYEKNIKYPKTDMPYSPFNIAYDKSLQPSNQLNSFYLIYNFLTQNSIDSENRIIIYHGYDNKRYFTLKNSSLSQTSYKVDKIMFLSHILYNDYIFKTELSYTDVIDDDEISDYRQLSFGIERGFYEILGYDINLYTEYYNYHYKDDSKIKNVDISELYNNDIFIATKINFNNLQNSELKLGILYDVKDYEKVYKTTFNSRVFSDFIFSSEYLQTITKVDSLLNNLGDTKRFSVAIRYTF